MPRDDLRRELKDAFSRISGSPSGDLQGRVRSALVDPPERRGPARLAGVAAVAIAVLIVGALFVVGPLRSHQPTVPVAGGSPTPAASPSPSPSSSPSSSLPAYNCGIDGNINNSGHVPQTAVIDAVRGGVNKGYDRFAVEFDSNGPASRIDIAPQNNATFTQGASGQTVQLQGSAGVLITIHGADGHTKYSGPTDFRVGSGILEVREVQDFEGVVQWALGLSAPACYHADMLSGPDRFFIDIQTS